MRVEDEFELLENPIPLLRDDFQPQATSHRVQLTLIIQVAEITGNRPIALLAICYQHVKVTLFPDPQGGHRSRVLVKIVYKYTKAYLGEKNATNSGSLTYRISHAYCSILTSPYLR